MFKTKSLIKIYAAIIALLFLCACSYNSQVNTDEVENVDMKVTDSTEGNNYPDETHKIADFSII